EIILGMATCRFLARRGRHEEAQARANEIFTETLGTLPGQTALALMTRAYVAVAAGAPDAADRASIASRYAKTQGAERLRQVNELLRASLGPVNSLAGLIKSAGRDSPW